MEISALLMVNAPNGLSGEALASVGIEITASRPAPCGEFIRVEIDRLDDLSGFPDFCHGLMSVALPLVEARRQGKAVNEIFAEPIIVLASIPGEAPGFDERHADLLPAKEGSISRFGSIAEAA